MTFSHHHLHSEYSILDGYTGIFDLAKVAKSLGQDSVACSDHGSLAGSLRFWKSGKEHEIKTIQALEAYITTDLEVKDKDSPTWHLVLLAQNRTGLNNLFQLSAIGWTDGFYKKPRIDHKTLAKYSEGIICLSACMAGEIARSITDNDLTKASNAMQHYYSIFGDRFYVELQPGNSKDLNNGLSTLADDLGIKCTVTVDSHYDIAEHKTLQELLLIIQQYPSFKKSDTDYAKLIYQTTKNDTLMYKLNKLWPNRGLRYDSLDLYIQGRYEVMEHMNKQGFYGKELCDTTLEIAERCEQVEFDLGAKYLPVADKRLNSDEYLRALVEDGLEQKGYRYDQIYLDRIEEELALIFDKQFSDYFLLVYDIINTARKRNIYVGPGRGSAAGSLVAYCLGITAVDPIKLKLLFFRFLDPSRSDYPDIDMDFQHDRRDEMKEYIREKYGYVLGISTYTKFHGKSLIRAISRVLGVGLDEVDQVCTQFNDMQEFEDSESPSVISFKNKYPEILVAARDLDQHIQSNGAHAAGLVVADRPMHLIVPIETRVDPEDKTKRIQVSAFEMNDTAEVGLIKFDFLGLMNLTVIHDCIDKIKELHDLDIDWESLEPDDPYVLSELSKGNTIGVFQMESSPYRKLLIEMGVDSFEDLVASNALVRPGAFNTVAKDYIQRKRGTQKVSYPHESVEEFLKDTYGVYIYQEQVMQMAVQLGGFSWAEANKLRKIIGKKLDVSEFKPYFEKWIQNAEQFISTKAAEKIWKDFEKHSGYSFNRSHAVAYSYIGYVTAWLKLKYPLEYIYSMLRSEKNATTRMSYLLEADRLNMDILGPDVNESEAGMSIAATSALRFGLSDIKGVGFAAVEEIITKRPFESWQDMQERITARKCNSKVLASLVAVDALRSLADAPHNDNALDNYQEYLNYPVALSTVSELNINVTLLEDYNKDKFQVVCGVTKNIKRTNTYLRIDLEDITGNITCFGSMSNDLSNNEVVVALVGDNTMLGYCRLDGLKERIKSNNLDNFEQLLFKQTFFEPYKLLYGFGFSDIYAEKSLVLPVQVRQVTTKAGKQMGFCYFCDKELNIVKVIVFPAVWSYIGQRISEWKPICVKFSKLDDGGLTLWKDSIMEADTVLESKRNIVNA